MGLPYSRQINAAFDQVTPLVARGFRVLETTKNIALLLAVIQVLTVSLLVLIVTAMVALLITMNPDLEKERQTIVTPAMKMLMHQGAFVTWAAGGVLMVGAMIGGLYFAIQGGKVDGEEAADEAEEEHKNEEEKKKKKEEEGKNSDDSASGKSDKTS